MSIDSSSVECPSVMAPSTGTFSPGRTSTRSPVATSRTGMSTASPPRHTRAVLACRPMSLRMASEVWPRARASSSRPRDDEGENHDRGVEVDMRAAAEAAENAR